MRTTFGDDESARLERRRQWTSAASDGGLTGGPEGETTEREPVETELDIRMKQWRNCKETDKTYIMNGD